MPEYFPQPLRIHPLDVIFWYIAIVGWQWELWVGSCGTDWSLSLGTRDPVGVGRPGGLIIARIA